MDQAARLEFCADYCAQEHCAKQIDGMVSGDIHDVIDRVKLYMAAIAANNGVAATLDALVTVCRVAWPLLAPSRAQQHGLLLDSQSADDAGKTPQQPQPLTLVPEQGGQAPPPVSAGMEPSAKMEAVQVEQGQPDAAPATSATSGSAPASGAVQGAGQAGATASKA